MGALDFTARGMAARNLADARRRLVLDKLRTGIRAGRIAPVMASPPTIGTPGASALTGTTYVGKDNPELFTFLRASWALSATSYMRPIAVNGLTGNGGTAPLVRFWSDAPDIEISHRGEQGGYRLYVDGELVQAAVITGGSGITYTRFTWGDGSGTYRKPRLYEVEGISNFYFHGARVPAISRVWPAPVNDLDLRIIVFGDSFVERASARYYAQLLGHTDTRASGSGGTGFMEHGGGSSFTFLERMQADVIAPAPEVIIETGGYNDSTTLTGLQAAVTSWLDAVQVALPGALIFMTGPMSSGNGTNTGNNALVRDAKLAAAAGRRNVFFIDNLAATWVTGTGKSGTTAGNGNADWVTDTDGVHPTDEGGKYLVNRTVQAMLPLIDAALAG